MSTLSVQPVYQGFLYRISNGEKKEVGHLAGTCHRFVPGDTDCVFSHEMEAAIQESDTIYLEVNPFEGIEDRNKIKEALNKVEVRGIEEKILNVFATRKKLKGLASIAQHLARKLSLQEAVYKNLNFSKQLPLEIQEKLEKINGIISKSSIFNLLEIAYKHGDKKLLKSIALSTALHHDPIDKINLWDINPAMAEKIHLSLQNEEKPFIAIGCAHLWSKKSEGEEGVIQLLRNQGWKVERISNSGVPGSLIDECTKLLLNSYRYNLEYLQKHLGINPDTASEEISKIVTELKHQIPQ